MKDSRCWDWGQWDQLGGKVGCLWTRIGWAPLSNIEDNDGMKVS